GNEVFIVGAFSDRVYVFDLQGRFLRTWGSEGDEVQFRFPTTLALDQCGRVYVTDTRTHVQVSDVHGRFLSQIKLDSDVGIVAIGVHDRPSGTRVYMLGPEAIRAVLVPAAQLADPSSDPASPAAASSAPSTPLLQLPEIKLPSVPRFPSMFVGQQ